MAWPWQRRGFQQLSIRKKLLALVLMPLLVVLPLLGVLLLVWSDMAVDRLLITKIRSDLAVASGYFERVLGEVGASTAAIAESHALQVALAAPDGGGLVDLLRAFKQREGLDFISLRAPDGTLRFTDSGPAALSDPHSPAHAQALAQAASQARTDTDRTSVEILLPAQLALLSEGLRSRVAVPLVATRNAAPTERVREERAMVLLSTRAVRATDGRLLGHVQSGLLLNHNLPFIDHINEIVYPDGSLPFGSRGTATLFLDDVRISTNVRLFGGENNERAIGTRVSRAVSDTVLGAGRTWLDRAFVVNDWYVSGYQPLADSAGRRVGMLYVGFTEAPFRWIKYGALLTIGALFFAVMLGAALVSLRWARGIFQPVERMARTMQQVGGGALQARVGAVASQDEIGQLAGHLDQLLDTVAQNTQELQRWNAELDAKVAQRTQQLEAAQVQLVRAEKLAAVGQLTASIAHEVNNPIAVLQGNLDLVRELLGPDAARVRGELKLADEQIERMRLIVTQLLQFARPTEFAGYIEAVDPSRLVEDCLLLANHLLAKSGIEVRRELHATRWSSANRQELQQVLVNLLVNAAHAMPDGGVLTLASHDRRVGDADFVEITVTDTGPGLGQELLRELFKPFVTRKKDGTGLGLWISRTIVDRYGGDLRAADRADGVRGAVFSVWLRCEGPSPD
ncbi:MAG TPA: cache domain-containing protein [Rubrivivax sp.]